LPIRILVSAQVHVRRDVEVGRRRLVLEDAAGQVEGRTVAGAQEAAVPVVRQVRLRAFGKARRGRAAQVRADADRDQHFLVLGARGFVLGVLGVSIWYGFSDFGSATRLSFLQAGQHFRGAAQDPDRLAAPFHHFHFARLDVGDIHFDRRAGGFRSLRRLERTYQNSGR
jgi:hypothetical protein